MSDLDDLLAELTADAHKGQPSVSPRSKQDIDSSLQALEDELDLDLDFKVGSGSTGSRNMRSSQGLYDLDMLLGGSPREEALLKNSAGSAPIVSEVSAASFSSQRKPSATPKASTAGKKPMTLDDLDLSFDSAPPSVNNSLRGPVTKGSMRMDDDDDDYQQTLPQAYVRSSLLNNKTPSGSALPTPDSSLRGKQQSPVVAKQSPSGSAIAKPAAPAASAASPKASPTTALKGGASPSTLKGSAKPAAPAASLSPRQGVGFRDQDEPVLPSQMRAKAGAALTIQKPAAQQYNLPNVVGGQLGTLRGMDLLDLDADIAPPRSGAGQNDDPYNLASLDQALPSTITGRMIPNAAGLTLSVAAPVQAPGARAAAPVVIQTNLPSMKSLLMISPVIKTATLEVNFDDLDGVVEWDSDDEKKFKKDEAKREKAAEKEQKKLEKKQSKRRDEMQSLIDKERNAIFKDLGVEDSDSSDEDGIAREVRLKLSESKDRSDADMIQKAKEAEEKAAGYKAAYRQNPPSPKPQPKQVELNIKQGLITETAEDRAEKQRRMQEEAQKKKQAEDSKYKKTMEQKRIAAAEDILDSLESTPSARGEPKDTLFAWNIKYPDIQMKEKLGAGTFGSTNRAFYKERQVTAKQLTLANKSDPFLKLIREEIPPLSSLQHPNLSIFYGISFHTDVWSVQEYTQGFALHGYLRNPAFKDDIEPKVILRWAKQMSDALAYLHANSVIHKALKTKNIILDRDMNVKIKDHGLLKVKEGINYQEYATEYDSPEVLNKARDFTDAVDVYSYAIILLELFKKGPVFGQVIPAAYVWKIQEKNLRPPISPELNVPFVFVKLIESGWQQDPKLRPSFEKISKILSQPADKLFNYATK